MKQRGWQTFFVKDRIGNRLGIRATWSELPALHSSTADPRQAWTTLPPKSVAVVIDDFVSTWQGGGMPRRLIRHCFCVCLWEHVQKNLAFVSEDWVREVSLTNAGGHHLICWGPEWNKKAEERWICSVWTGISTFSALGQQSSCFKSLWAWTEMYHWLPWFSGLGLGLDLHYRVSWGCSLQMADCGTSHNCVSQSLIINLFLYVSIYPIGSASLEKLIQL